MNVVLIVEDEALEQEFLKSVALKELQPEDKLFICGSGIQAVQLAKQHRPNIIIMDIMISEMDGLTAIQEIRKFLPDACITILSAYSDFTYAQKAINLKVFDYLLKPVKPSVFKEMFQRMLTVASRKKEKEIPKIESPTPQEGHQGYVQESIEYINEHFKEKLSLETVASRAFMNPKYFSRIFKKETGMAFTEYIIQLRIQYACRLLETTNYPAYRISAECGFSDPSYFNRVFCAKMQMTPQTYRKNICAHGTDH